MSRWTPETLQFASALLGKYDRIDSALPELTARLGFAVTRHTIRHAFADAGMGSPNEHLRRGEGRAIPDVADRDTERFPVAEPHPLPDDSDTTLPRSQPPVEISEVTAHRQRQRIAELEARTRRLVAELAAREDELAEYKSLARGPIPIDRPTRSVEDHQRKGVPVLLCSDWHYEEEVDPRKVNGLNEYNIEIADRCIDRLADGFEWMLRDSRFDCRTAVIALMGDMMTGYIHPELMETNALSPQQTQVRLLDRLEAFLRKIAVACPDLDRIIIPCVSGNHGRATERQRVSTREANSNEQVVYQTLARVLRDDPRFEFHIADGEWLELDVMGYGIAITHGDSFNYGGGVGGVSIPIRRGISRQFQHRKFHQFCMGHFHTRQDFGDIQINGSMIGYGPYSQRIHAPFEERQQSWFMIDSERGKCISAPIWL